MKIDTLPKQNSDLCRLVKNSDVVSVNNLDRTNCLQEWPSMGEKDRKCDVLCYNHRKSAIEKQDACNGKYCIRSTDNSHSHRYNEYNKLELRLHHVVYSLHMA